MECQGVILGLQNRLIAGKDVDGAVPRELPGGSIDDGSATAPTNMRRGISMDDFNFKVPLNQVVKELNAIGCGNGSVSHALVHLKSALVSVEDTKQMAHDVGIAYNILRVIAGK